MKALWSATVAGIVFPWLGSQVYAQPESHPGPQVKRGEEIAQARCSACHIVAQNQEFPPLLRNPAPSFQSIADRPETTGKALQHFVATTHWDLKTVPITMPNPELSKSEAGAVVAYILSLKGP